MKLSHKNIENRYNNNNDKRILNFTSRDIKRKMAEKK